MMKLHIPFLALCALTFLPIPVHGQSPFIRLLGLVLNRIFFTDRRDSRDCRKMLEAADVTTTESCSCASVPIVQSLFFTCDPMNEDICFVPNNLDYCTDVSSFYSVSASRDPLRILATPAIEFEQVTFNDAFSGLPNPRFLFIRGDPATSSQKYEDCKISWNQVGAPFLCIGCTICPNGLDFTYDCSNGVVGSTFNNQTNTTEDILGPIVDTCIPVADIIPSF